MLYNFTGFATDANVLEIADSRVPADPPTPVAAIHTATSHRKAFYFRLVVSLGAGSDRPVRCREAAAREPHYTIEEPDTQKILFLSHLYETWARYPRLSTAWDMFENKNATGEQSISNQLYQLDIECIRLVNNHFATSAFVATQEGVFQVPASLPCNCFGLTNSFEIFVLEVSEPYLFARKNLVPALHLLMLWNCGKPECPRITMTPWSQIISTSMLSQAAWGFLFVWG